MADTLEWIDPDGAVHALVDGESIDTEWPLLNRFGPRYEFVEDRLPFDHGSKLRDVRAMPRDIPLAVTIFGPDEATFRNAVADWAWVFNPLRGDSRLRSTRSDGTQREITCRINTGFEGNESPETGIIANSTRFVLNLRVLDPFWRSTSIDQYSFVAGTAPNFFPFPFHIGSASVFGESSVYNWGTVEAWPLWTITGPGSDLILTNQTTGDVLSLPGYVIPAGQQVVIDTRYPGSKTIMSSTGVNLMGYSTGPLWSLERRANSVKVEMANVGVGSRVDLAFRQRYSTP